MLKCPFCGSKYYSRLIPPYQGYDYECQECGHFGKKIYEIKDDAK